MPRNVDGARTRPGPPGTMGTRPDGAAMQFTLIDNVLEQSQDRIRAVKQVSAAEEYLADHFPGFPILPGVMMIEVLVQAARTVLESRGAHRFVLGEVKALKYGTMVRPGEALEVEVNLLKEREDGSWTCKGKGILRSDDGDGETVLSGRFTMRPVREHPPA